jgi:integrase
MTAHQSFSVDLAVPLDSILAELEPATDPVTFADLATFAAADETVSLKRRKDAVSAVGTLFKKLGLQPVEVALSDHPDKTLTRLFERLDTAPVAPTGRNRRNIKSRCRKALHRYLTHIGYVPPDPIQPPPLPPDWQCVRDALPKPTGFSPKRFIDFAVAQNVLPQQVDEQFLEAFAATLGDMKHPKRHLAMLIKCWNSILGPDSFGYMSFLPEPERIDRCYAVRLDEPLARNAGGHCGLLRGQTARNDPEDRSRERRVKPYEASSADKALRLLRQFLGVLRLEGIDVRSFRGLADAITLDNIDLLVSACRKRTAGETSSHLNGVVGTLSAIARHHLKWPREDLEWLWDWFQDHRHPYDGMVERNIQRLLILDDPRHRRALLDLPCRLMDSAEKSDSERGAYDAQIAIAIELLLQTAMRIGNLSGLRFDQHVIRSGVGQASKTFILVKSGEVKNSNPIRVELPAETAQMLELYRTKFLPRLRNTEGDWLFPGERGRHKGDRTLAEQVQDRIRAHTGLDIHPHLFRAIAVFIYLKHHPGDYLTMQRVLGDRSLQVVLKHYTFLDQIEVRRGYQEAVRVDRALVGAASGKVSRRRGCNGCPTSQDRTPGNRWAARNSPRQLARA